MIQNILLLVLVSGTWGLFCYFAVNYTLKIGKESKTIAFSFSSSQILLFLMLFQFNSIILSSITSGVILYTLILMFDRRYNSNRRERINRKVNKFEEDSSIRIMKNIHRVERYLRISSVYNDFFLGLAVGVFSGFPLILSLHKGASFPDGYVIHVLIMSVINTIYISFWSMKGMKFSGIKNEDGNIKWIKNGSTMVIEPENIEEVEEKFLRAYIHKESGYTLKIWTKEPSKVTNLIVANKV